MFIAVLAVGAFFTVKYVKKDKIAIVIDNRNSMVDAVLSPGVSFVLRGIDYKNVSLKYFQDSGVKNFTVKIMIPQLSDLNDDTYAIIIPVDVSYVIISDKIKLTLSDLKNDFVKERLNRLILAEFSSAINKDLDKGYDPNKVEGIFEKYEKDIFENVSSKSEFYGLKIKKIQRSGNVSFPSLDVYNAGIDYKIELIELEQKKKLEKKRIDNSLELNNYRYDNYIENLKKMSKIIKENPLLLKYIYIDKLAGTIKIDLPVDSSGYPLNMNERSLDAEMKNSNNAEEIDNFR